jgi:hypothetical protein
MELDEFTEANAPKVGGEGFQRENKRLLDIALAGTVIVSAESTIVHRRDDAPTP